MIEHLTKETFKEKIFNYESKDHKYIGNKPCIIDFYADWCSPCKILSPHLEEILNENSDQINIYKINIEEEIDLSIMFQIKSIPTMIFFPVNEKPVVVLGAIPKSHIISKINDIFHLNVK